MKKMFNVRSIVAMIIMATIATTAFAGCNQSTGGNQESSLAPSLSVSEVRQDESSEAISKAESTVIEESSKDEKSKIESSKGEPSKVENSVTEKPEVESSVEEKSHEESKLESSFEESSKEASKVENFQDVSKEESSESSKSEISEVSLSEEDLRNMIPTITYEELEALDSVSQEDIICYGRIKNNLSFVYRNNLGEAFFANPGDLVRILYQTPSGSYVIYISDYSIETYDTNNFELLPLSYSPNQNESIIGF